MTIELTQREFLIVDITFELSMGNSFEQIYNFFRLEIIIEINELFIIL